MPFGLCHRCRHIVASIIGQGGMAKAPVHFAAAKAAESMAVGAKWCGSNWQVAQVACGCRHCTRHAHDSVY